jgi:hypothetical protein
MEEPFSIKVEVLKIISTEEMTFALWLLDPERYKEFKE